MKRILQRHEGLLQLTVTSSISLTIPMNGWLYQYGHVALKSVWAVTAAVHKGMFQQQQQRAHHRSPVRTRTWCPPGAARGRAPLGEDTEITAWLQCIYRYNKQHIDRPLLYLPVQAGTVRERRTHIAPSGCDSSVRAKLSLRRI